MMPQGDAAQPHERPAAGLSVEDVFELSHQRVLTANDFGGWTGMIEMLPNLVEHPLLVVASQVLSEYETGSTSEQDSAEVFEQAAEALAGSITATNNPAIFRDSVDHVLRSKLVELIGPGMAGRALEQAAQPPLDATARQELRAADALETAVQLCLGGWGKKWDLFSRLEAFDGRGSATYARAVLRATVACIEQWVAAADLLPVVRRVAGLDQPLSASADRVTGNLVDESDAGIALARIATLQALRCTDNGTTSKLLDDAVRYLGPALDNDDRPDAEVAADLARLLQDLLTSGTISDPDIIDRVSDNVRELLHLDPGRDHWVRNRVAASHVAWSKLVVQLSEAHQHLAEVSWYRAAAVIDDIVDLYRTTNSSRIYCRAEDGAAVHAIVTPTLEAGFAEQASLLRHLEDHVRHLEDHVRHLEDLKREGQATPQQLEDLPVAIDLRDAAVEQFRDPKGGIDLKGVADGPGAIRESPAEPTETSDAISRIGAAVRRRRAGQLNSTSLVVDELLERARAGFANSLDYHEDVAEATDLITHLLVTFLWDRNQLGEREADYLYREDAAEEDLASDLHTFLRGSGQLGSVTTEVRHIAGGRIDIQFGFPGFNLYVELKKDATKVPVPDKRSYLGQAASYQVADKRIGFLLVLKLLPEKKELAPHLLDCLEVVEVLDAGGKPRHVAAVTLSGARTKPSDM